MRLDGIDFSHIDAPWPIPCDNRQGLQSILIHLTDGPIIVDSRLLPRDYLYMVQTCVSVQAIVGTEFMPATTGSYYDVFLRWKTLASMVWGI
jgi:hypothetical protein